MIRNHLNRALLISAGLLLVAGAAAQAPQAAPAAQAQNAGGHGDGHGDGHGGGDGHGDGHGNHHDNGNAAVTPGAQANDVKVGEHGNASDRGARMKAEHESERAKLIAVLHAPLDDAGKQELKKHALRVAYLERIKALATAAKDQDAIDRATKLLEKETARHDKWLASLKTTAQANPTATPNGGAR